MHNKNWDDLRFVLAVVEAGSVNAAATDLGVNHATVLRRISAFESHFDVRIFDRNARGYTLLPDSRRILESMNAVKEAVKAVERSISGRSEQPSGLVRLTSTDTFCTTVLPDLIAGLARAQPLITLEIKSTNAHVSLSHMDADVTVRPAMSLPNELTGVVAAKLGFAVYGHPSVIKRSRGADIAACDWLGVSSLLGKSAPAMWIADHVPPYQIRASADSFVTLRDLAISGMGIAILPCCLGDPEPELSRWHGRDPDLSVNIWVATHADMAQVGRIKTTAEFLISGLNDKSQMLSGRYRI